MAIWRDGREIMVNEKASPNTEILETLDVGASGRWKRMLRWGVGVLLVVAVAVVAWEWFGAGSREAEVQYVTAAVRRSDLTVIVTATGNLRAVNQVEVGSEISGIIKEVLATNNDRVEQNQVIARLDTDKLRSQVALSRATLDGAKARVAEAKATVVEKRLDLERARTLTKQNIRSRQTLEAAVAASSRALAQLALAEAQVREAQAKLQTDETNLAKAVIRAPIAGIVLERRVEPGQTVAASFQAPVLFVLAENLSKMELWVDVDEADVGNVKKGLSATFTVDAYPNRKFEATITRVNFASKITQGVVTYETLLAVDNKDLFLRPGMTVTAEIRARHFTNVLLVPNAAVRFVPPPQPTAQKRGLLEGLLGGPRFRRPAKQKSDAKPGSEPERKIWTLVDGEPVSVPVRVGASDGRMTIVEGGKIAPDMKVIVDVRSTTR
jgi:HlyD family secretion protein